MCANELEGHTLIVLMDAEVPKGLGSIEPLWGALEKCWMSSRLLYYIPWVFPPSDWFQHLQASASFAHGSLPAVNPCRQSTGMILCCLEVQAGVLAWYTRARCCGRRSRATKWAYVDSQVWRVNGKECITQFEVGDGVVNGKGICSVWWSQLPLKSGTWAWRQGWRDSGLRFITADLCQDMICTARKRWIIKKCRKLHTSKFQSTLLTLLMLIKGVHWVLIMLVGDVFATLHAENLTSAITEVAFFEGEIIIVQSSRNIDRQRRRLLQYTMYRINLPWWERDENEDSDMLQIMTQGCWHEVVTGWTQSQIDQWSQPDAILPCHFPIWVTPLCHENDICNCQIWFLLLQGVPKRRFKQEGVQITF